MRKAPKQLLMGLCLFFLFGLLYSSFPPARTVSLPFNVYVSAFVSVSCTAIDFGSLIPGSIGTSSALITVRASKKTTYHIALDAGLNFQVKTRNMLRQGGTDTIPYALWKEDKKPDEWGDKDYAGTYPYGKSLKAVGNGKDQVFTVTAKCQTNSTIVPGIYRDIVTITVHY